MQFCHVHINAYSAAHGLKEPVPNLRQAISSGLVHDGQGRSIGSAQALHHAVYAGDVVV